jgi:hypothetical protein
VVQEEQTQLPDQWYIEQAAQVAAQEIILAAPAAVVAVAMPGAVATKTERPTLVAVVVVAGTMVLVQDTVAVQV